MKPEFLSIAEVLEIHRDQIDRYGGSLGIRDLGLLQSALAQPQVTFKGTFLHRDLIEMGAAYLYHLTQNHPFLDGNKRVGAVACLVFLILNDVEVELSEEELETAVHKVASSEWSKAVLTDFLRQHSAAG